MDMDILFAAQTSINKRLDRFESSVDGLTELVETTDKKVSACLDEFETRSTDLLTQVYKDHETAVGQITESHAQLIDHTHELIDSAIGEHSIKVGDLEKLSHSIKKSCDDLMISTGKKINELCSTVETELGQIKADHLIIRGLLRSLTKSSEVYTAEITDVLHRLQTVEQLLEKTGRSHSYITVCDRLDAIEKYIVGKVA